MQACQWEVIKTTELHFVISLCLRNTRAVPQTGQDGSSIGPKGEEYVQKLSPRI